MSENGAEMQSLQDLVLTRMAELGDRSGPISAREVARRSNNLISYETLRAIARGLHSGRISDRTAEGLSIALQVPAARVYEAAGINQPVGRWQWPARFDRLDTAQRRLVEDVAGALLEAHEKGRRDAAAG